MKQHTLLTIALLLLLGSLYPALPVMASDPALPVDLGLDRDKLKWGIFDYGIKEDGTPFAVARKYYTDQRIKANAVDLLMIELMSGGYPPQNAGGLYFTEYEYEYTKDGKQFAVVYASHYDGAGAEIYSTVYDNSTEAAKKTFSAVGLGQRSTLGAERGVLLALPELASADEAATE